MCFVSSFAVQLQELAAVMTVPSFQNFVIVLTGWAFARRRTVTGMLTAAGVAGKRHHAVFHRLFAQAAWSLDALGLAAFRAIEPWLDDGTVFLAIDDTLARKRGLKTFGLGMPHDPLLSSRGKAITNWGHSWVVLGVIVRFPRWPKRVFCLPILFRLYLNEQAATQARRVRRSRPELAVEMLQVLCKSRKNRPFHAVADSAYGGQSVLCALPDHCELTSPLVLDARLYAFAAPRAAGSKGRPRKRGVKLPTPAEMLKSRTCRLTLDQYGRRDRVRVAEATACVFAAPANRSDHSMILPTVKSFPNVGGKPGRPLAHPKDLYADAGFDSEATRSILRWLGIEPHIRRRGDEHGSHLGRVRWVVERSISWIKGLRRMRVRYDRSATSINA